MPESPKATSTRLLILDTRRAWGGGERYVESLLPALAGAGCCLTVLSGNPRLLQSARAVGARAVRVPAMLRQRRHVDLLVQLLAIPLIFLFLSVVELGRRSTDVHILTTEDQMLCTPFYSGLGRRVTWSIHGPPGFHNRLELWLYRRAVRGVAQLIAVSAAVRDSLVELGIESERVVVVANGVSIPVVVTPRTARGPTVTVGFVGRLEPIKAPDLFLDVAQQLTADDGIDFVMFGAGSMADSITREIRTRGLSRVRLAGFVANLDDIFGAIDVLLLTSRSEGFALVVAEAGAAGVPAVVVDLPPLHDLILDQRSGLICERDPAVLATAVRRLAHDSELRERMGETARSHIAANYSQEQMLRRTLDVLLSAPLAG